MNSVPFEDFRKLLNLICDLMEFHWLGREALRNELRNTGYSDERVNAILMAALADPHLQSEAKRVWGEIKDRLEADGTQALIEWLAATQPQVGKPN